MAWPKLFRTVAHAAKDSRQLGSICSRVVVAFDHFPGIATKVVPEPAIFFQVLNR